MQLKKFCIELGIESGKVNGIGVVRNAVISYFELASMEYLHREFMGNMEMTSLMGNISFMEGEPFLHLHVTLADENFQLSGGHLTSAEIGVTGELTGEPSGESSREKLARRTG